MKRIPITDANFKERADRYLALIEWARSRYSEKGILRVIHLGQPTIYARIEDMAAARYIGTSEHYPTVTLKAARAA